MGIVESESGGIRKRGYEAKDPRPSGCQYIYICCIRRGLSSGSPSISWNWSGLAAKPRRDNQLSPCSNTIRLDLPCAQSPYYIFGLKINLLRDPRSASGNTAT